MRLAIELGYINVDGMLDKVSSSQLAEWLRFYAVEPFGAETRELHLAAIRVQIANYLRPKGVPPYTLSDFMLSVQLKPAEQTPEAIYTVLMGHSPHDE